MVTSRLAGCLLLLHGAVAGCQWVPRGQFEACQARARTLAEQNRVQLAEIENLKIHNRHVEDGLIRAEEDLARLDARHRRPATSRSGPRPSLASRSPAAVPATVSDQLALLARRYSGLEYDPATGVGKLDADLLFDSGQVELSEESSRLLADFARVLRTPEAQDLKVMVVGHTDSRGIKGRDIRQRYPTNWHLSAGRALAVAERLRDAGLAESRLGVTGFGQHQPLAPGDTAENRQLNRRVEIYLLSPDAPAVGWQPARGSTLR
jgi:flagellar motor protein MotB